MSGTTVAKFIEIGSPVDLLKDKAEHLIAESAIGYGRRGGARYDRGRFEEAIADFEKSLELDPTASAIWLQKAVTHRKQGKLDDAKEAYIAAANLLEGKDPQLAAKIKHGLSSITAL